jgi:hypothetical protein
MEALSLPRAVALGQGLLVRDSVLSDTLPTTLFFLLYQPPDCISLLNVQAPVRSTSQAASQISGPGTIISQV